MIGNSLQCRKQRSRSVFRSILVRRTCRDDVGPSPIKIRLELNAEKALYYIGGGEENGTKDIAASAATQSDAFRAGSRRVFIERKEPPVSINFYGL